MLFAGSKPEVQSILGLQEQNKICLQSNPPQCFDIGDPFQQAETGGIKNKVFDKSTIRQGGFTKPSELDLMDIREILRRNEEKFKAKFLKLGTKELELKKEDMKMLLNG
tara:strand:- start:135 stop:461 length:327 start_codon:yes stop_codon:yes gene_type:complete